MPELKWLFHNVVKHINSIDIKGTLGAAAEFPEVNRAFKESSGIVGVGAHFLSTKHGIPPLFHHRMNSLKSGNK